MSASRPPAVLQLAPRLDADEVGRDTLDLARHVRAAGLRSLVACAGGDLLRELAAAGVTHLPLVLDGGGRLARWRSARRLATLLREHDVTVVHAQSAAVAAAAVEACRVVRVPIVATLRAAEAPPRPIAGALAAADRLIAVSEFVAEAAAGWLGAAPRDIRMVRRWIDTAELDPERVRGHRVVALAERWDLPSGPKTVLVPPLPPGDRGHLLLLRAMARLPRTDFVALFAGGQGEAGAYGAELLAAVRKAGLGERVRFGGATADLAAMLALADLVVLPATRPEPSGILAAAAQAMGRPVIVTNRGALPEAVMPAATGWLVPPDDPAELAGALDLALAMDEDARRRLADRARAFVSGEFGMAASCERILAIYRELSADLHRPYAGPPPLKGAA